MTQHTSHTAYTAFTLTNEDRPRILSHLLRLSVEDRGLRFFSALSDYAIQQYVEKSMLLDGDGIGFGIEHEGSLIGFAHVNLDANDSRRAEAAFSIDVEHRGQGLSKVLMARTIEFARERGAEVLYMCCLHRNKRMQALARSFGLKVVLQEDEAYADLNFKGNE